MAYKEPKPHERIHSFVTNAIEVMERQTQELKAKMEMLRAVKDYVESVQDHGSKRKC